MTHGFTPCTGSPRIHEDLTNGNVPLAGTNMIFNLKSMLSDLKFLKNFDVSLVSFIKEFFIIHIII